MLFYAKNNKKAPHVFRAVLLFLVEITGPIQITVTLLQSMHGAFPAELNPHSFGSNKKSTTHFCVVLFLLVEIAGPIQITVTLLQSMHGALPGELNPHSFGINKKAPHISVWCFLLWWRLPGSNR